ncbi:MAG TPA: hypothetical protein VJA21_31690 [Verrucomicrobiae bacterium]
MQIRATADLGALGAKEGPATSYKWSPPCRLPQFLAPLALLLLLLPKRNRALEALWVGVPVALSLAAGSLLCAIPKVEGNAPGGLFGVLGAVVLGLGAVWLLSPYLRCQRRLLTFLGMLATMELAGLFAFVVARLSNKTAAPTEMLVAVAAFGLLMSLAINLAGWTCGRRFGPLRLLLWAFVWLFAGWATFFIVMSLAAGHGPWLEEAVALLIFSGVSFGLLLPFLILSLTNAFYRERLKEVLHLAEPARPTPSTAGVVVEPSA